MTTEETTQPSFLYDPFIVADLLKTGNLNASHVILNDLSPRLENLPYAQVFSQLTVFPIQPYTKTLAYTSYRNREGLSGVPQKGLVGSTNPELLDEDLPPALLPPSLVLKDNHYVDPVSHEHARATQLPYISMDFLILEDDIVPFDLALSTSAKSIMRFIQPTNLMQFARFTKALCHITAEFYSLHPQKQGTYCADLEDIVGRENVSLEFYCERLPLIKEIFAQPISHQEVQKIVGPTSRIRIFN